MQSKLSNRGPLAAGGGARDLTDWLRDGINGHHSQPDGGVHSPEVCFPGSGWEISWLERSDLTKKMGADSPLHLNRAIIQKGEIRMMVYYWFQQKDRRIAWDFAAKFWLTIDGIQTGRTDGALVRLTALIDTNETVAKAAPRLFEMLEGLQDLLPRFIPTNREE